MKRSELVLLCIGLFAFPSLGSSQTQNPQYLLAGTGYPTSMNPGNCPPPEKECNKPLVPAPEAGRKTAGSHAVSMEPPTTRKMLTEQGVAPAQESGVVKITQTPVQALEDFGITASVLTITDAQGNLVNPSNPPKPGERYKMDYSIAIADLISQCDNWQSGNLSVGYDFLGANVSTDQLEKKFGGYGPNNGSLESFTVSILQPGNGVVYSVNLLQAATFAGRMPRRAATGVSYKRYPLSQVSQQAAQYFVPGNVLVLQAAGFENIYVGVWCNGPQKP